MSSLVECVPNFSEGRDPSIINSIAEAISSVDQVHLLEVDPGYDANRTVMTFMGRPKAVLEAAFLAIKKAQELIDMSLHKGKHPRIGATDVCPLIPIRSISMDQVKHLAQQLAQRVGDQLSIPVYLYENSALAPYKRPLSNIRKGEYEGLKEKIKLEKWHPDFGPKNFNSSAGATAIGARPFLIAYNVNLDTKDTSIAQEIAETIRTSGTFIKDENGKPLLDKTGRKTRKKGLCKALKAIGWYMDSYGFAQVSTNITNFELTPIHEVFETVKKIASTYNVQATGSELIGMIPKFPLLESGKFYLMKEHTSEPALIAAAVRGLNLDQLKPFDPTKKILESNFPLF